MYHGPASTTVSVAACRLSYQSAIQPPALARDALPICDVGHDCCARLVSLWYNETALKIPRAAATARVGAGRTQRPRAATREILHGRFKPTHRSCNRCCRRCGNRGAAGVRAGPAGNGPADLAGWRQDRILSRRATSASATPRSARASRCSRRPAAASTRAWPCGRMR